VPEAAILHTINDGAQREFGKLLTGLLWAGGSLVVKILYDLWKGWRAGRQKAKQSQPTYLADKAIRLSVAADRVCQWSGADHASIYLLSNGQYAANGDSIQKVSMVGEGTQMPSQRRWMVESQNLPTSLFPHLMTGLSKGPVWLYQDEAEDYQMNHYMRTRGYSCRLVLPLHGAQKALIGLLCISWNEGKLTDEVLPSLADLENHRRECAAILAQS
jgi:hypothetical protein